MNLLRRNGKAVPAACPRCESARAQKIGEQVAPLVGGGSTLTGTIFGCLTCRLTYTVDDAGVRAVGGWKAPEKETEPERRAPASRISDRDLWDEDGEPR